MLIIPEALLVPISLLLLIFLSILWGRKAKTGKSDTVVHVTPTSQIPNADLVASQNSTPASQVPPAVIDYGEISIQKPTIAYYKRMALFVLLMLAGVFYPCFVSIPYYLLYFLGIFLFMFKIKMDSQVLYWYKSCCCHNIYRIMNMVSFYTGIVLIAFSLSRLAYLRVMRENSWAQMVGFFDLANIRNFAQYWPGYIFLVVLIALYILVRNTMEY